MYLRDLARAYCTIVFFFRKCVNLKHNVCMYIEEYKWMIFITSAFSSSLAESPSVCVIRGYPIRKGITRTDTFSILLATSLRFFLGLLYVWRVDRRWKRNYLWESIYYIYVIEENRRVPHRIFVGLTFFFFYYLIDVHRNKTASVLLNLKP